MSTPTVFFDMDGTLVDSMYYWDRATSCVLNALGILPDDEMEEEFARLGFYRIPAYVAERFPELGPPEAFAGRVDQWMLARYRSEGARCVVLTASAPMFIEAMVERYRLEDCFAAAFSARQLGIGKEDPAIYTYLFEQLDCTAEDCVLFDDSPYAVRVASQAGLRTVGVLDPFFPQKHQALREICTRTISRYSELL